MSIDLLATPRRPAPTSPPGTERRRRVVRWMAGIFAASVFLSVLGWLIDDQVQAHDQTARAHAALTSTRRTTAKVSHQLAQLRHDVEVLATQVGSDHTAYEQDAAQLKAAQTQLASTQVDVSQQTTKIAALHSCLGGVEQALNALAVGHQAEAIGELSAVATSCTTASGG